MSNRPGPLLVPLSAARIGATKWPNLTPQLVGQRARLGLQRRWGGARGVGHHVVPAAR